MSLLINMITKKKKSKRALILLFLLICLLFSLCLFVYLSSLQDVVLNEVKTWSNQNSQYSQYFLASNNHKNTSRIIHLEVYYESLCSDSQTFINNQLDELLRKNNQKPQFQKHVRINLIPFGKADVGLNFCEGIKDKKFQFRCQHGFLECYANKIHNCAIDYYSNRNENELIFRFISCAMERFGDTQEEINEIARQCLVKSAAAYTNIHACANSVKGSELLYAAGVKTKGLDNPPMNYIPWFVLNDIHTTEIQQKAEFELEEFICDLFKFIKVKC